MIAQGSWFSGSSGRNTVVSASTRYEEFVRSSNTLPKRSAAALVATKIVQKRFAGLTIVNALLVGMDVHEFKGRR